MNEAGFTRQERYFVHVMRFWAVLFFVGALIIALFPDWILYNVTRIGAVLAGFRTRQPVFGEERFWLVLAVTLLLVQSYASLLASTQGLRQTYFAKVVIFSHFISAIGFALCFWLIEPLFFYLTAAVVDGLIFIVIWYVYHAATASRS